MNDILEHIKRCMAEKQNKKSVNYEQAAKEIDIAKSTIFNILNENKNPTLSNFESIIHYTGCTIKTNSKGKIRCIEKHSYKNKR